MRRRIRGIQDVAEWQQCTGCGICAFVQPDTITMVDDLNAGRRPIVAVQDGLPVSTSAAMRACPGIELRHGPAARGSIPELEKRWGPVLELWEGYAADEDIRRAGSSGGAATAFALQHLETGRAKGVLHIRARKDLPLLNETVLSTCRQQLLASTGSRYAPASPCDGLQLLVDADGPGVFIGKPCDVAATQRARVDHHALDESLALTIAIFCAGTPNLKGTLEVLERMGIDDPSRVEAFRYRGNGWPGEATATFRSETGSLETRRLTYDQSWGEILQRHRQWRCYVCADHTGEFADIAVGDPWYRTIEPGEPGRSLILARTERGRAAVRAAIEQGVLIAQPVPASALPASQPGLRKVRGAVWGRLATLAAVGLPHPRYHGLPTLGAWLWTLSWREKMQSTLGTLRRVFRKGLHRRQPVRELEQ